MPVHAVHRMVLIGFKESNHSTSTRRHWVSTCSDMSHRLESNSDHANRERVDDAVRVLARLLARQAAAEFRMSQDAAIGPADEGVEDDDKE